MRHSTDPRSGWECPQYEHDKTLGASTERHDQQVPGPVSLRALTSWLFITERQCRPNVASQTPPKAPRATAAAAYDWTVVRFLHTMYRITDPVQSRAFYNALGLEFRRELPIVREGEVEATNYFFAAPGQAEELELTFNHDGRGYEMGTAYGHIALGVDDLDATLSALEEQGIKPEREPYRVREGGSRLCFVRDPDDYRIELIEQTGRSEGD